MKHWRNLAAWVLLTVLALAVVPGCSEQWTVLTGDYEIMEGTDNDPVMDHLWLGEDGEAMVDGVTGTWKAQGETLTLTVDSQARELTWSRDGYWLTLTQDDQTWRYIDSTAFAQQDSDPAVAGEWLESYGWYDINLNADGTGWYYDCELGTQTTISWQAHDGLLRLEYQEESGLTFEYLNYRMEDDALIMVSYGGDIEDETQQLLLGRSVDPDRADGTYSMITSSDESQTLAETMQIASDGTLTLGDQQGEWTDYQNGLTVFHLGDSRVPVMLVNDGDTLVVIELMTGLNWLWADETGFAEDPALLATLVGQWEDSSGHALALAADGTITLTWDDEVYTGTATASGELLRVKTADTVYYVRFYMDGEKLRLAMGVTALDESDNWPALAQVAQGETP